MKTLFRPYGNVEPINLPIWDLTGANLDTVTALVAGDLKISFDGGATFGNVTTLPANVNGFASWVPAGTETQHKSVIVKLVDQGTKVFLDSVLEVETYSHASALHAALGWVTGDSFARLGAPAGATIAADVALVQADTNDLQTQIGTAGAGLTNVGDSRVAAIKTRTDLIPNSPAAVGSAMTLAADALAAVSLATDAVTEVTDAIWAKSGTIPLPVDVKKINAVTITGAGVSGNEFQP